jgi:hypothetical protein
MIPPRHLVKTLTFYKKKEEPSEIPPSVPPFTVGIKFIGLVVDA